MVDEAVVLFGRKHSTVNTHTVHICISVFGRSFDKIYTLGKNPNLNHHCDVSALTQLHSELHTKFSLWGFRI